jgi:hypothetical protein
MSMLAPTRHEAASSRNHLKNLNGISSANSVKEMHSGIKNSANIDDGDDDDDDSSCFAAANNV